MTEEAALHLCREVGCPNLVAKAGRCPDCRRTFERLRGSRQDRGYDAGHDAERRRWVPVVAAGRAKCAKCGEPILPGTPWHLGHNRQRTAWTGPEHAACNLEDAGKASHGLPWGGG